MKRQQRIDAIMESFDFQKVHDYMLQTGWTWGWGKDAIVPSVDLLRSQARALLERAAIAEGEFSSISTGGFHAHKWTWGNEERLELVFALEQQDE